MKEELSSIERNKPAKERSLSQLKANLEAMMATKEGLESELHQDLMATLSVQVSIYLFEKQGPLQSSKQLDTNKTGLHFCLIYLETHLLCIRNWNFF